MTLHTNGVSLVIRSTVAIPAGGALTCDTSPARRADKANYVNLPGSLVIGHGAFLDAVTHPDAEIYNCAAIIPEWYINPGLATTQFGGYTFMRADSTSPPFVYADLEKIRANMILGADWAIEAGEGAKIHDLMIGGFDNCLYVTNSPNFIGKIVSMDCSIGAYFASENGGMTIKDFNNNPYLTKQTGFDNEEYWTISNVTRNSTTGECELTLNAVKGAANGVTLFHPKYSVQDLTESGFNSTPLRADPNYYPVWITGLGDAGMSCLSTSTGRFGNDAAWGMHNITNKNVDTGNYLVDHATVDLVGSRYTSSQLTGISVDTQADWPANTGIVYITGPISNLTVGMTATSSGSGWPTTATITAIVHRCTGPDPNDGYNGCLIVSPAPTSASTGATIHFYSLSDSLSGGATCDGKGSGPCFFYNAGERYVAGNSDAGKGSARLPSSRGGHLGAGFLLNNVSALRAVNASSFAHYYNTATVDAAQCNFVQIKGDENGELDAGNSTGIYVSGFSRGCEFLSQGPGQKGSSLVQDTFGTADGSSIGSTSANGLGSDPTTVGVTLTGLDTSDTIAVPDRGEAHLCSPADCTSKSEIVAFSVASRGVSGSITVVARDRFGTAPQDWTGITAYVYPTKINNGSVKHEDKSASTIFSDLDNPTVASGNAFEILHGGATLINVRTSGNGTGFISTNTSGVTIVGGGDVDTDVVFEDENAKLLTSIDAASSFANYAPRALTTPLVFLNPGPDLPQVVTDTAGGNLATTSGIGHVAVQNVSDWPTSGIALVDNEYVVYTTAADNTDTLIIDRRGACGSVPAPHAQYAVIVNAEAILGCSAGSTPFWTLSSDGAVSGPQSLLAHGQVYMSYDGSQYIKLCARGGGGLIINGILRQVSAKCVPRDKVLSGSSAVNYVYADYHAVGVSATSDNGTGKLRLTVTANTTGFGVATPISCILLDTMTQAVTNIVDDNATSLPNSTTIDVADVSSPALGHSSTGECSYIALRFDTTGHATGANGVEMRYSGSLDPTETLVGMVYVGAMSSISDTITKRDVASWFNRRQKTCRNSFTANRTTASTSYVEVNSEIHCEFVTWGQDDLRWSIAGTASNAATSTKGVYATLAIDTTTQVEEAEISSSSSTRGNVSLSGSNAVTEGWHYITLLGKTDGNTATYYGATPLTSIGIQIPQ
jgi:hypothetical protein